MPSHHAQDRGIRREEGASRSGQRHGSDVSRLVQGVETETKGPDSIRFPFSEFRGKTITQKGMIRLPIQTDSDVVEVDFIVVNAYSPYTAIVARPWLHALGAVSSTLHQKVKYPSKGREKEVIGNQAMARQCMVSAISRRPSTEPSTSVENDL